MKTEVADTEERTCNWWKRWSGRTVKPALLFKGPVGTVSPEHLLYQRTVSFQKGRGDVENEAYKSTRPEMGKLFIPLWINNTQDKQHTGFWLKNQSGVNWLFNQCHCLFNDHLQPVAAVNSDKKHILSSPVLTWRQSQVHQVELTTQSGNRAVKGKSHLTLLCGAQRSRATGCHQPTGSVLRKATF